jgi:hypothetical protein
MRDRLSWPAAGAVILALAIAAWIVVMGLVRAASAQAPEPLFRMAPVAGLCGALADHVRVLEDNRFEPAWRGQAERGDAFLVINHEGYWMLLLVFAGDPPRACLIADGARFDYAPAPGP